MKLWSVDHFLVKCFKLVLIVEILYKINECQCWLITDHNPAMKRWKGSTVCNVSVCLCRIFKFTFPFCLSVLFESLSQYISHVNPCSSLSYGMHRQCSQRPTWHNWPYGHVQCTPCHLKQRIAKLTHCLHVEQCVLILKLDH